MQKSGMSEAQAAAIATAISGSEARMLERFDDLSVQLAALSAKVDESEKANSDRILKLALWLAGLVVASSSAVIAAVAFLVT